MTQPAVSLQPPTQQPSLWRLAWRQMARDFRAGELRLLVVAVMLAVAALTAVGFFADRINNGLARDARQMLGGDAIVASDQPAPASFAAKADELGLSVATTAAFPSMGRAPDDKGGATRLVGVKAVSDTYPLRGQVRLSGEGGAGIFHRRACVGNGVEVPLPVVQEQPVASPVNPRSEEIERSVVVEVGRRDSPVIDAAAAERDRLEIGTALV